MVFSHVRRSAHTGQQSNTQNKPVGNSVFIAAVPDMLFGTLGNRAAAAVNRYGHNIRLYT